EAWLSAGAGGPGQSWRQRDENEVRADVQRCGFGSPFALYRFARQAGTGGESREFRGSVRVEASGGFVYFPSGPITLSVCLPERSEGPWYLSAAHPAMLLVHPRPMKLGSTHRE